MARRNRQKSQPWGLAVGLLFASGATLVGVWMVLEPHVILGRALGSGVAGIVVGRMLSAGFRSLTLRGW
jgi:hypothetical protein